MERDYLHVGGDVGLGVGASPALSSNDSIGDADMKVRNEELRCEDYVGIDEER